MYDEHLLTIESEPVLKCFDAINLSKVAKLLSSSRPSTCMLNPVPARLYIEIFPLISTLILDVINLSLFQGYIPTAFKVAVIKVLLKNSIIGLYLILISYLSFL